MNATGPRTNPRELRGVGVRGDRGVLGGAVLEDVLGGSDEARVELVLAALVQVRVVEEGVLGAHQPRALCGGVAGAPGKEDLQSRHRQRGNRGV